MQKNKYIEIIKKQQELINLFLSLDKTEQKEINAVSEDIPEFAELLQSVEPPPKIPKYNKQAFTEYLKKKGKSENTIANYTDTLKLYFAEYDSISVENLEKWETVLKSKWKPKTINLRIIGMTCYLKFIGFSGYEFVKVKEQKKVFCDNAINEQQYNQLVEWAKINCIQTYKIAKIIGNTGVRVSELVELKTTDLDKGYVDITSKGNKTRRIYFPKSLVDDIKPYCNGEYLITNRFGSPMTTRGVSGNLVRAGEKAGIAKEVMHPHSFRHFFAKQFLKHNNDITLLGDLLGHSNISTTAIYTRLTSEEQKKNIDSIVNW